jgi:hypothetical protein
MMRLSSTPLFSPTVQAPPPYSQRSASAGPASRDSGSASAAAQSARPQSGPPSSALPPAATASSSSQDIVLPTVALHVFAIMNKDMSSANPLYAVLASLDADSRHAASPFGPIHVAPASIKTSLSQLDVRYFVIVSLAATAMYYHLLSTQLTDVTASTVLECLLDFAVELDTKRTLVRVTGVGSLPRLSVPAAVAAFPVARNNLESICGAFTLRPDTLLVVSDTNAAATATSGSGEHTCDADAATYRAFTSGEMLSNAGIIPLLNPSRAAKLTYKKQSVSR